MRRRRFGRAVTAIAIAAMALATFAASARAEDGVERRIRRAVGATQKADTARVAVRIGIESAAASGDVTAEGVVSMAGDRAQLAVDVSDLAGSPASFEERIVDGVIYLDFGSLLEDVGESAPSELAGKRWIRVDPSALGGLDAEQLRNLDPTGGANPTSQLDALRGIDGAARVGTEDIEGVRTTHFRGTLRLSLLRKQLAAVPDDVREQVEASIEQLFRGDRKLPVDLWLDGENRLRQMRTRVEVDDPTPGVVTVTMTIPEFDVPVDVSAPPAEETVDFGEFQDLVANA